VILDEDDKEIVGGQSEVDTTISRMELMAPIDALDAIMFTWGPSVVLVHSDSEYVVKGITDRTRQRKKNVDLWDRLDSVVDDHVEVVFEHVRGHSGDHYNELVDRYAGTLRCNRQKKEAYGNSPS
jgi:ribonuclease HI